jgi:hypothetical protein
VHRTPGSHPNDHVTSKETEAQAHSRLTRQAEVEKVVILSFRNLQLRRIGELQDKLLRPAVETTQTKDSSETHNSDVDMTLRAYGEYALLELYSYTSIEMWILTLPKAEALRNYETLSLNGLSSIPIGGNTD